MNQLNSIIIEGNVVKAGVLKEPAKGFKVCSFPVAVNRFYKNPVNGEACEEVSFFDVEAFGKVAEVCEKNSLKGRGVRVVGRLKQDRWKTSDGKAMSRIYVVAEHVEYKPKFNKTEDTASESKNEENESVQEETFVEEKDYVSVSENSSLESATQESAVF